MLYLPIFSFYHKKESRQLDVIMHGVNEGIESRFMSKIVAAAKSKGNSVVGFNFEFFERNEKHSSGEELEEERATLQRVLEFCKATEYDHIRLIGKSLGGIVLARYLRDISEEHQSKFSALIFGYDIGYIDIKSFTGSIKIVQGSRDKYGNLEAVKKDLINAKSKDINLIEIEGASHSYCNPENDEPIYEDEAITQGFL